MHVKITVPMIPYMRVCYTNLAVYSLDNVRPKLKYTGKKVVFNKIIQFDDKSQGDLALASLFVISNS